MIDEMRPRFDKDEGSLFGEEEPFEDIDLDFFTKRSGDDIIENGNNVSTGKPPCLPRVAHPQRGL